MLESPSKASCFLKLACQTDAAFRVLVLGLETPRERRQCLARLAAADATVLLEYSHAFCELGVPHAAVGGLRKRFFVLVVDRLEFFSLLRARA